MRKQKCGEDWYQQVKPQIGTHFALPLIWLWQESATAVSSPIQCTALEDNEQRHRPCHRPCLFITIHILLTATAKLNSLASGSTWCWESAGDVRWEARRPTQTLYLNVHIMWLLFVRVTMATETYSVQCNVEQVPFIMASDSQVLSRLHWCLCTLYKNNE